VREVLTNLLIIVFQNRAFHTLAEHKLTKFLGYYINDVSFV